MEDHTQREYVALWVVCFYLVGWFYSQDLWSHIARCTTPHVQVFLLVPVFGQSYIHNDREDLIWILGIFLDHNILKFEISVHDSPLMHVIDSFKQASHDSLNFGLVWETVFLKISVQRKAEEFHDDISGILCFENTLKLANVLMREFSQKLKLFLKRYLNKWNRTYPLLFSDVK